MTFKYEYGLKGVPCGTPTKPNKKLTPFLPPV